MTDEIKNCVDCATPLIGDCLRCGACNVRLDAQLAARATGDNAPSVLARWVVAAEVLGIMVLGLLLAVRGCST